MAKIDWNFRNAITRVLMLILAVLLFGLSFFFSFFKKDFENAYLILVTALVILWERAVIKRQGNDD